MELMYLLNYSSTLAQIIRVKVCCLTDFCEYSFFYRDDLRNLAMKDTLI